MMKLKKEYIKAYKKWLEGYIGSCPTYYMEKSMQTGEKHCLECIRLFPNIGDRCPCNCYSPKYVKAQIRHWIEETSKNESSE